MKPRPGDPISKNPKKRTIRKFPPITRQIAKLLRELNSASRRLTHQLTFVRALEDDMAEHLATFSALHRTLYNAHSTTAALREAIKRQFGDQALRIINEVVELSLKEKEQPLFEEAAPGPSTESQEQ